MVVPRFTTRDIVIETIKYYKNIKKITQNKKKSRIRKYTMETNEKIGHISKPIKCQTMGFEPLTFNIAHVDIIIH